MKHTRERGARQPRRISRRPRVSDRGLVLVYYGDGKGKTTAALGAVLRAVGHGWSCAVIQFIKGSWPSSERDAIPRYLRDLVTIEAGGKGFVGIVDDRLPRAAHRKEARALFRGVKQRFAAWQRAWENPAVEPRPPRLVILDEVLDAVQFGFLTQEEVLRLVRSKPAQMHLLLTGHRKFPAILAAADLVTRMTKEKHPYDEGFLAVRGLDY